MKRTDHTIHRRNWLRGAAILGGTYGLLEPFEFNASLLASESLQSDGHDAQTPFAFEVSFPAMGSLLHVRWFDSLSASHKQATKLAAHIRTESERIADHWNNVLSDYDRESQASLIAEQADDGEWIVISHDLGQVINDCDRWNKLSAGAFDASIGAVTRLRRRKNLPKPEQWAAAQKQVGWEHLEWDGENNRIRFQKPGLRFDFGAIGKGWVVDRIFECLTHERLDCCSIDFSGNMRLGSSPPNTVGWPVSIDCCNNLTPDNLRQTDSPELLRLRLRDQSISTSGNRWQMLPDSRSHSKQDTYSHIVDPQSMRGVGVAQNVTILTRSASEADAASTATSVLANRDLAGWLEVLDRQYEKFQWLVQISNDRSRVVTSNL